MLLTRPVVTISMWHAHNTTVVTVSICCMLSIWPLVTASMLRTHKTTSNVLMLNNSEWTSDWENGELLCENCHELVYSCQVRGLGVCHSAPERCRAEKHTTSLLAGKYLDWGVPQSCFWVLCGREVWHLSMRTGALAAVSHGRALATVPCGRKEHDILVCMEGCSEVLVSVVWLRRTGVWHLAHRHVDGQKCPTAVKSRDICAVL